jgi:hypothetical protein
MIAPIKKYRILGTPKRKISILPMANNAPAIPVPPGILETLICGVGDSSLMPLLLSSDYHHEQAPESLRVLEDFRIGAWRAD